jgi:hypothetical protein
VGLLIASRILTMGFELKCRGDDILSLFILVEVVVCSAVPGLINSAGSGRYCNLVVVISSGGWSQELGFSLLVYAFCL